MTSVERLKILTAYWTRCKKNTVVERITRRSHADNLELDHDAYDGLVDHIQYYRGRNGVKFKKTI